MRSQIVSGAPAKLELLELLAVEGVASGASTTRSAAPAWPDFGGIMPTAKLHALTILGALDEARSELVGKAVVLTDGKAGTVENVWLDELHGLRISIRGHDGKWPVSTIKFAQTG